jgi:hypothetical protein
VGGGAVEHRAERAVQPPGHEVHLAVLGELDELAATRTESGPDRHGVWADLLRDRQAAGWLKVATSCPNANMWSLIVKASTAPRVSDERCRLVTSSANTDTL